MSATKGKRGRRHRQRRTERHKFRRAERALMRGDRTTFRGPSIWHGAGSVRADKLPAV